MRKSILYMSSGLILLSAVWLVSILVSKIKMMRRNIDVYSVMKNWNYMLQKKCDQQNEIDNFVDANYCSLSSIRKLNRLIQENHDQIFFEVQSLLALGYKGFPMSNIDKIQKSLTRGSERWSPIWVKFMDSWAGTASHLPTLQKIIKEVGNDILLLHVSVFNPGTELPYHRGISRGVWRYHYGLQIPEGDLGLEVEGKYYRWREREGFIWDDTLLHRAWNKTDQIRLVIFADVHRQFNPILKFISRKVHSFLQKTKQVKEIKKKLEEQGVIQD